LRDPHGVRRRKTEFAAGFLLQCRGGERRLRIAPRRPCLDAGNREAGRLNRFLEIFGFRARANVEALNLLAVGADQPRLESLGARFSFKTSSTCQEIASPSRSGSVARISRSAPFSALAMSLSRPAALGSISQIIWKFASGSTEPFLAGRSRTWPNEARTS